MPFQLPVLDNRQYKDLVEEARSLIPVYAPAWTNHNPTDPGLVLIELFAYLTEMLLYRLDCVTDVNLCSFLKLLDGQERQPTQDPVMLAADMRRTIQTLRQCDRAVTAVDFVKLAMAADSRVARAHCLPQRALDVSLEAELEGHISVIIVPKQEAEKDIFTILLKVSQYLEPRRLLTTQIHVVKPLYLPVSIKTEIIPRPDVLLTEEAIRLASALGRSQTLEREATNKILSFFKALPDGDEPVWPFGRNIYLSEIYELLDHLAGVDYVSKVDLSTNAANRYLRKSGNDKEGVIGIEVKPWELVEVTKVEVQIKPVRAGADEDNYGY